jgi:hypothetical protein
VLADNDTSTTDGLFDGKQVKSVAASGYRSLAVDELGRVWAWGYNVGNFSSLGDGTTTSRSRPVNVQIAAPQVSVSAIPDGVCAGVLVAALSGGALDGGYSAAADVTYTWTDVNSPDTPLQSGLSGTYISTEDDVGKGITVTVTGSAENWQDLDTTSEPVTVSSDGVDAPVVSGTVSVDGDGVVGVPVSVKKTGTNTVLGSTTTGSNGGFSFGCSVWDAAGWDVVFTNSNAPVGGVVSASSRQFDTTNISLDVVTGHGSASLSGVAVNAGTGLEITMVAPFEVEFDTGTTGVTSPVSQLVFPGGEATAPSGMSRVGYSFDGWWATSNYASGTQWVFTTNTVSEPIKLFAKWVEKFGYTVSYDLNYENAPSGGLKTGVSWTGTGLLPVEVPKRVGYRFVGWTVASDVGSAAVTGDTAYAVLAAGVEVESVSVFAQWSNLNVDTDNDGEPDINIDTDGDDIPDINIDIDNDGIPDLNVVYRLLDGEGFGVFTGDGVRSVSVDAPYSRFVKLLLGDDTVTASNYTVVEGSTVITLQESYLATFTNGTYWFTAVFDNGVSERIKLVVDIIGVSAGGRTVTSTTSLLLTITSLGMLCVLAGCKRRLPQTR